MRVCLSLFIVLSLAACKKDAGGSDRDDDDGGDHDVIHGDNDGDGDDDDGDEEAPGDDDGPGTPAFERCFEAECKASLECVELGANSYCLRPCTDGCPDGQRCQDGYCYRAAGPYETCNILDACESSEFCYAAAPLADARCVPICAVGDLGESFDAVAACPSGPEGIHAQSPACTSGLIESSTAELCAAPVDVGELCDQAALLCDSGRSDTDLGNEGSGGLDPGALTCLAHGIESRCSRICTIDGGATTSSCVCPVEDAGCHDPEDAGLAWECVRWQGLDADVGACALVEECDDDDDCTDNVASGLVKCGATPYEDGPAMICVVPE